MSAPAVQRPEIRMSTVPMSVPPRTTLRAERERDGAHVPGQQTLAVDFRGAHADPGFGPQFASHSQLPDVEQFTRVLVTAILEVVGGQRSASQLMRHLDLSVYRAVAQRGVVARRRGVRHHGRARLGSVSVCHPADGVAEVAAVVHMGGRSRAVALRLVGADRRWLVTALQMG